MREKVKSLGLILAIAIAGITLPTSIMSFMDKPTHITEINNYYYNNTVIEQYNNTILIPMNRTVEIFHFYDIPDNTFVINKTYNIISDTIIQIGCNYSNFDIWIYRGSDIIFYKSNGGGIMLITTIVIAGFYRIEIMIRVSGVLPECMFYIEFIGDK